MITFLILLINVSFKIIVIHEMMFTASSVICSAVAIIYLLILKQGSILTQRHLLHQCLLALYVFSIGIYILVNIPAADYMHDNPAYQIVFEDIPKKFFASTLAFGLSFYLPHVLCCAKQKDLLILPKKRLLLAIWGGFSFFTIDFFLLFSDPHVYNFNRIYVDSLMVALLILFSIGVLYLSIHLFSRRYFFSFKSSPPGYLTSPLYNYLVALGVTSMLVCLACEYRLISFSKELTLAASGLVFPITLMVSNLIGELFGLRANLRLCALLILAELVFDFILMAAVALPSPDFFNLNPFYSFIIPRRIPSSTLALSLTFISNTLLLEKFKTNATISSRSWRIIIANALATSLLCLVNYSLLFSGIYPYEQILSLTLSVWIFDIGAIILCLPLLLRIYKRCVSLL